MFWFYPNDGCENFLPINIAYLKTSQVKKSRKPDVRLNNVSERSGIIMSIFSQRKKKSIKL